MYGFVEKELAELIGCECFPFQSDSGKTAVLVNREIYVKIKDCIENMHPFLLGNTIDSHSIGSIYNGAKILLHPYWRDFEIFDSFTDGAIKATHKYTEIMNVPIQDRNHFVQMFYNHFMLMYNYLANGETNEGFLTAFPDFNIHRERTEQQEAVEQNLREELLNTGTVNIPFTHTTAGMAPQEEMSEQIQIPPEIKIQDEIELEECKKIYEHMTLIRIRSSYDEIITKDGKKRCMISIGASEIFKCTIDWKRFINDIDKNIIISTQYEEDFNFTITNILKSLDLENLYDHIVMICISPESAKRILSQASINIFGETIPAGYAYIPFIKDANKEIENVRSSPLSEAEKNKAIQKIISNRSNSPYSQYDMIFKDTYTGGLYALKKNKMIILMIKGEMHLQIVKKIFIELGRRFYGKISRSELEKIDKEYADEHEEIKMELFTMSSIKSATKLTDELKTSYTASVNNYKSCLDKAMEYAKSMYDLKIQLDAFSIDAFIEKEKIRIKEMYRQILDIPHVLSIDVNDKCIIINTKNIYAIDSRTGKFHDIGTFQIKVGLMSPSYDVSNTVRIFNTKHKVNAFDENMQAPHVFGDGHICHGNLAHQIANAYAKKDLFAVIQLLIIFLQEANVDDPAGKYINKWPEVLEDEVHKDSKQIDNNKDQFDSMLAQAIPITIK